MECSEKLGLVLAVVRSKGWLMAMPNPEGYGVHYRVRGAYEEAGANVVEPCREVIRRVVRSSGTREGARAPLAKAQGMGEYPCYEFQALDRRLSPQEMARLRALPSRPKAPVEHHFNAFVYLANWGTRRLMLRLPSRLLDLGTDGPDCGVQHPGGRHHPGPGGPYTSVEVAV